MAVGRRIRQPVPSRLAGARPWSGSWESHPTVDREGLSRHVSGCEEVAGRSHINTLCRIELDIYYLEERERKKRKGERDKEEGKQRKRSAHQEGTDRI